MKKINDTQKDILGTLFALSLVFTVIGYFTVTQPDYSETNEEPATESKHVQSAVLEKYGKLFTKNQIK